MILIAWLFLSGVTAWAAPINTKEAIPIGGIKQWISMKGTDGKAPVLLFLHGGPGNSVMSYANRFTNELQKHFVVVQWDQRGSGKTANLNHPDIPLTVYLMTTDAVEVTRYLCARFKKEKIYLAGHSWGGFLALRVAHEVPELLLACIPSAPMINQLESERQTLDYLLAIAREKKNAEAIGELERVKIPFETGDQLYFHRRWLMLNEGKNPFSRGYVSRWASTWLSLFNEACRMNLFELEPEIHCPVYFLVGANDRQAYSQITAEYYKAVKAEKKDIIWFTNSGHNLNLTESEKFQDAIIALLPPKN